MIRRPLVWFVASLIAGMGFASACAPPFRPVLAAFLTAWLFAILLLLMKKRVPSTLLTLAASFLLGACMYEVQAYVSEIPDEVARNYSSRGPLRVRLFGVVAGARPFAERERATFTLDADCIEANGVRKPVSGKVLVNWYQPASGIEPGDIVSVSGKLQLLEGFKNPRSFDYERYMYRRGIFSRMYARGPEAVAVHGTEQNRLSGWRNKIRQRGLEIISVSTRTDETRAFLSAILLGERGLLTPEMQDWFKRAGTFHVLAISGLHVGLVYLIASLVLASVRVRLRVALGILIVWFYAVITGGSVPVIRASIMLTLVLAEYYLNREGDFLTAVAFAALLIVSMNPTVIDEASFQLSFTAVVLLCTFEPVFSDTIYPALQQKFHRAPSSVLHKLAVTLYASLVVGVGMLPLVAYHFNLISFVFPLANIVVIPALSLVLASGFACLAAGFIWMKAAILPGLAVEAITWVILGFAKLCSAIPGSSRYVPSPPIWVLGLVGFGIILLWWNRSPIWKMTVFSTAAGAALAVAVLGEIAAKDTLKITFLDVGDADSSFVEFPDGSTMLVDTGFSTPSLDCGERIIAPYLWKRRKGIDTLVLTHSDNDHTGGASFLMKNFRIEKLVLPDVPEFTERFSDILHLAKEKDITVEAVHAGQQLLFSEDARVDVLNPPPETSGRRLTTNESSVVLKVTCGNTSALLTGDAEKHALRFVSGFGEKIESQVLKTPHHGRKSSFSKTFVETVRPRIAVISGRPYRIDERIDNRLANYAPLCHTVLSTKECGAIEIESDGSVLQTRVTRTKRIDPFSPRAGN